MAKSQFNKTQKVKAMEFKQNDEVVIVDEKVTTVFEAKQVNPTEAEIAAQRRRWIESLSDCA